MRDFIVFAIVLLTLPMSYRRPFVGLLLFSWLAYMRPQDLCWGFARSMRFSFYVGMTMIAGWWANERQRVPFTRWDLRTRLILWLLVMVTVSFAFAEVHSAYTIGYYIEFLKIIVVALFTVGQCTTRQRLRALCWTIALCLGFYGIKGGFLSLLRGGGQILRGPGGMMEDNNDFALALVMNVPMLYYLGLDEGRRWIRRGTLIGIVLTVITVLLTQSRGGFLALVASLMWISWRSQKLFRAALVLLLCVGLFFAFAPQEILDRIASIGNTEETSAASRLVVWGIALRMISDFPILGVGVRNFQDHVLDYAPTMGSGGSVIHVAHNSYLQIWAECGTPAFLIYLLILLSVFVVCHKVFRIGSQRPDLGWLRNYARMFEATTAGFMVGAFFLNRGHFDLIYHWLAMVTALAGLAYAQWVKAPVAVAAGRRREPVRIRMVPALSGATVGRWERTS